MEEQILEQPMESVDTNTTLPEVEEIQTPTIVPKEVEEGDGSFLESIQGLAKDIGIPTGKEVEAGIAQIDIKYGKKLDAIATALIEESLAGSASSFLAQQSLKELYPAEDGFDMRDHMELLDGVDERYYHNFKNAHSARHAEHLSSYYKKQTINSQYLDKMGWEGTMYRVAGNLIDLPLAIALTPAGGAFVKEGSLGAKVADKWWLRGAATSGVEGLIEGVKQVTSQRDRTELEMGLSLLGGFVGGTIYKPQYITSDMADIVQTSVRNGVDDLIDPAVDTATSQSARLDDFLTTSNVFRDVDEVIDDAINPLNKAQEAIRGAQFSVKYRWFDSPSETMRAYGNELFDDILNPSLDSIKKIEVRDRIENSIASAFSKNFDPLFMEYGKLMYNKGSASVNRMFNTQLQQEFNTVLGKLYHNIDDEVVNSFRLNHPEFVQKAEQAFKQMSHDSYDIMSINKHPKFVDGTIAKQDDYMPLSWNKKVLQDDVKNGLISRGDFREAVASGLTRKLESLGLQVDAEKIKYASQSFTDTLMKEDPVAGSVNYIIQDNMLKRASDELIDMLGLTDREADMLLERITKTSKPGTASATKARTPLDLTATYTNEAGHTVKLTDYLDTDVQHLWHKYGTTMGGDTALRQLGITSREELSGLRNQVVKELSDASGKIPDENIKYLTNFDQTIGHLLGMSGKEAVDKGAWKTTRILHNMIRSSKLGATWIPMTAELARTTHQVGVKNLIKSLPVLNDMRKAWKGKGYTPYMQEAQLWQSLGNHFLQMPSIAKYDETLGDVATAGGKRMIDKFEDWSYRASEVTMQMGGVKSGTSGLEALFSVGSTKKMMDKAFKRTLSNGDYKFFEEYGFSREMTDRIVDNIKRNADRKFFGGNIMNFKNWDEDVANMFNFGIRRKSYEIIQRSNFGDNMAFNYGDKLVGDTIGGSLAMSLKNYMLVAYNKQLSAGLTRIAGGGREMMDTFGNWTFQASLLSLAYMGKVYATYGDDEEKMEEMLAPDKIAFNTFGMTTFSTFLPPLIDKAYNFGTGENLMPQGTRGGAMDMFVPVTYLNDVGTGIGGIADLLSPANSATEYQMKKGLSVLPMSNFIGTRWLTNELAKILAEEDEDEWD